MDANQAERCRKAAATLAADLRELAKHAEALFRMLAEPPHQRSEEPTLSLIDDATFSVRWHGRNCHLGYTISYRLLLCLCRRPNRFISHQELFDVVWGGPRSESALRSAIADLRKRLTRAGMKDLARAIDGHNFGHYGLRLREFQLASHSD